MKLSLATSTGLLLAASASAATNMTALKIYDDDSCTGVPLQIVFTPTTSCSSVTSVSKCSLEAQTLGLFASASCTDAPHEFSATTFNGSPYVLVEVHRPESSCDGLEGVAAYRIDSDCHPTVASGTSFQVDWTNKKPHVFKLFADSSCSPTPVFQLDLKGDSSECVGGSMKLLVVAVDDSALVDTHQQHGAS